MKSIRKREAFQEEGAITVYIKLPKTIYDKATMIAVKDGATLAYVLRKWIERGITKTMPRAI